MMIMKSAVTTLDGTASSSPPAILSKILDLASALLVAFSLSGCMFSSSLSESSNSISTSFNSSFKSSKSSSEESKEAYLFDVRQYTAIYTGTNSDVAGLARGLAAVSEKHGITNWEADNATYVGIGAGLAKANLSPQQVALYMADLAKGDQLKIAAIRKGINQGR